MMIQMDDLTIKVCILLIVQLLLIIALSYICGIFQLNGKFINFISKNNNFEILINLILFFQYFLHFYKFYILYISSIILVYKF